MFRLNPSTRLRRALAQTRSRAHLRQREGEAAIPRVSIVLLLLIGLALPASAQAGVRKFRPERVANEVVTFKLRGLEPAIIRSATVHFQRARHRVSLATIRRAARRGVLRVPTRRLMGQPHSDRVVRARPSSTTTSLTVSTCSGSSSSYTDTIKGTAGLVSYWRLGESSGSVACDESQRNPGTYSSGVSLGQSGAIADGDRAAGFNSTSRLAAPSSASLAPGSGVSAEAWIKPRSTASQTVVRKDGQYLLRISGGKVVGRVWLASGSYVEVASSSVVQTSGFQHLALTYDGSQLRLYRNGTIVASRSASGIPAGSGKPLLIGSSDGYDGFDGTVDEAGVYNQALSREQVAAHTSAGPSATATPAPEPAPAPAPDPTSTGCASGWGSFSSANMPGACWRPYADSSLFNRPVPSTRRVVSNSSQIVERLTGFGAMRPWTVGHADTADDWYHPVYYSQSSDPVYTIDCLEPWGTCEVEGAKVRIPAKARPAGGGDGHLTVIDQAAGVEYDFWQVQGSTLPAGGGTVQISWGGKTTIGAGVQDGLGSNATAAHFGGAAGIMRGSEAAAAKIDHALFLVVHCTSGQRVGQAAGTGRSCAQVGRSTLDAPAMGQHFFLDMSDAEIDALAVAPWQKTVLRAMAKYGLIVGDTGGNSWEIQPESGSSYTSFGNEDPWVQLAKQVGVPAYQRSDGKTSYSFDMSKAVDFRSKLKVLDPCHDTGGC